MVLDESGAVVSGATVTLTNEGTGVAFTTTTSAAGTYSFDGVQIGDYSVTVERTGFRRVISSGNRLGIGVPLTVNVTLPVGAVAEVVEVTGTAELVQTSTSGNIGAVIGERQMTALPIVGNRGRNPLSFVNAMPGVTVGSNTGGGVHVHGARDRAFNFTLDGVDTNETSAGGSNFSPLRTNPDGLAEFRVLTGNFSAEYGRNSGAQVDMVTKSGTNSIRGSVFWFYQTPRFHANEYNRTVGCPTVASECLGKTQFVQHIGGFSVGGPVIKNRTFFFGNFQGLRTRRTSTLTRTVYTQEARNGLFRYVAGGRNFAFGSATPSVDANGNPVFAACAAPGNTNCIATYNVATNDPRGAAGGLDPSTAQFIGAAPLPNNFTVGDGLNTAGYTFTPLEREAQQDYTFKIDHMINPSNTVFARYSWGQQDTLGDIVNAGQPRFPGLPNVVDTVRRPKNLATNWRWSPTPTTTNEFIFGFNRFFFSFDNPDPNATSNPPYVLNLVTDPIVRSQPTYNRRTLHTWQAANNLSHIRGSHTLRGGVNFRWGKHIDDRTSVGGANTELSLNFSAATNSNFAGHNLETAAATCTSVCGINTGFDLPRLRSAINDLLGRVGNMSQAFVAAGAQFAPPGTIYVYDARYPEYDFYFQDNWKVRPNLTVDFGLRWELRPSPSEVNGNTFRPNQAVRFGGQPSNTLMWEKGQLFNSDYNNIGPTVGFAWDPFHTGKTSVRANYRLAYDRLPTFTLSSHVFPNMPGMTTAVTNTAFGQGGGRIRDGLPTLAPSSTPDALRQPGPFSSNIITVMDPDWVTPKTHMWSFGIQREIGWSTLIEVNYVGRAGRSLMSAYDANQAEIFSNGFLAAFNTVRAGGDSTLINDLLSADPGRPGAMTGSQWMRAAGSPFVTNLNNGAVGAVAATMGRRTGAGGVPVVQLSGFSPFFFFMYPQFSGSTRVLDSYDYSNYHAMEAQLVRRFSHGVSFNLNYTLSKSLDTRSFDTVFTTISTGSLQSASSTPFDINNRDYNYARSDFDRRHVIKGFYLVELPFGRGKRFGRDWNGVVDRILGGWEVGGVFGWASGRPLTVYSGFNMLSSVVTAPANCSGCTPDMLSRRFDQTTGNFWYVLPSEQGVFSVPAPGENGNLGRNFFTHPSEFTTDMSLVKRTRITERQNVEYRLEMQNLTNTPSFGNPNSAIVTSGVFMRSRGNAFNNARKIQMALKFHF